MKCKDCAKFPFCSNINNANNEACKNSIKRKPDDEFTEWLINRENSIRE